MKRITTITATTVGGRDGHGTTTDGGFALEVELKVNLPGINKAEAEALVVQADHTCPYSHAIRGNVPVKITVE